MKKLILSTIGILMSLFLLSQNETDALRYSYLMYGGTSRFVAMGGAFSALGADFSTLSTNPGGIGVYKTSEMMFAPQINFANATSTYNSHVSEDSKAGLSLSNIGMVFAGDISTSSDQPEWKNIQFGFGVNRAADFNSSYIMSGDNSENSILDVYKYYADGKEYTNLNSFDTELAWNTWLLDTLGGSNSYVKAFDGGVYQQKSTITSGGINEMVLSFGGNYNDRFYLGGTMGFPYLRYVEDSYYKEIDNADTIPMFNSLAINDEINTTGTGFNFKLGMIFRITDWVRISGAVHTPSFFRMHDTYSRVIKSEFSTNSYESVSPQGVYDYKMTTPMRMMGGIAFIIKKMGVISADYEMVDYGQARIRSTDPMYDFMDANENITTNYTVAHNFKVGTEWVFKPFSVRGGFSYYGSPFANSLNDMSTTSIHAGFGIREKFYFIDFAYVYSMRSEDYYLYSPEVISNLGMTLNPVKTDLVKSSFLITLGLRFSDMN
ncbi:MAG: hypothetical protein JXR53_09295 [Bacteroidales bacterium]|nr:hypothetical protein [Bacteroidales bacterium]